MDVRVFNTGRKYQADGQWIGYARINDEEVMFVDVSRFLDGVIRFSKEFELEYGLSNDDVLAAYDRGQREGGYRDVDYDEHGLRDEITRAVNQARPQIVFQAS